MLTETLMLGASRTARADTPLMLDGDRFWLVEVGRLDVFGVDHTGRRSFLFRVDAGEAVFSAYRPAAAEAAGLTLCAVGQSGTMVRELTGPAIVPQNLVELIDGWIDHWYALLANEVSPARAIDVRAGDPVTLQSETLWRPAEAIGWLRMLSGRSALLGATELGESVSVPTPVAHRAWVRTVGTATIALESTATVVANDLWWDALAAFERIARSLVSIRLAREIEREGERLRARSGAAGVAMTRALARLAHSVRGPTRRRSRGVLWSRHDATERALFTACRLVGDAAGVTMREPPKTENAPSHPTVGDQVNAIARASRVRTRIVALRGAWWRTDNGPLLARTEEGSRPIALLPRPRGGYILHDTGNRTTARVTEEVAATLHPFALTFYRPFPEQTLSMPAILRFAIRGSGRDVMTIIGMGALTGLFSTAVPIASSILFNATIPDADRGQLVQLAVALVICAGASAMFQVARAVAQQRVESRMSAAVQSATWDRLLALPTSFFQPYSAGDLAVRAMGIEEIRQELSGAVLNALLAALFSSFNFILLFLYDAALAGWACALIAGALLVALVVGAVQVRHQRAVLALRAKESGLVLQLLTGVNKLRVAGAQAHAFARCADVVSRKRDRLVRARTAGLWANAFNAGYPVVSALVLFHLATPRVAEHHLGVGDFLAFITAFNLCLAATLAATTGLLGALTVIPLFEQARPILTTPPEVDPSKAEPGPLVGGIDLQRVTFRYVSNGPPVLNDLSLAIEPGSFVAFVGPSGSGKSTILRLLLGFEAPESGSVAFDGRDLKGLNVHAIRRQMGVVLQSGRLMTGDIFTNIAGSSLVTIDAAWEAARMAGLDEDIKQMPMGMHTVISEGGGTLSGGQRQRLLIARAIIARPKILLFDEATSALDNRTQAVVTESLHQLQATRIVIAHRLSTIVQADRIHVLRAGRLVESGSYHELLAAGGTFADLARRQLA
jgi:NHLM bacteriocin system ABC transporter ATP-binding protein